MKSSLSVTVIGLVIWYTEFFKAMTSNKVGQYDRDHDSFCGVINNRFKHYSIRQQREALPIFRFRTSILHLLEKYRTIVLIGGNHMTIITFLY